MGSRQFLALCVWNPGRGRGCWHGPPPISISQAPKSNLSSRSLSRQHAIIKHDLTCPDCGRSADAKNICVRTFKRLLTISAKHSNKICHHFNVCSKPWARVHIEIIISVKLKNFSDLVILVLLFVSST